MGGKQETSPQWWASRLTNKSQGSWPGVLSDHKKSLIHDLQQFVTGAALHWTTTRQVSTTRKWNSTDLIGFLCNPAGKFSHHLTVGGRKQQQLDLGTLAAYLTDHAKWVVSKALTLQHLICFIQNHNLWQAETCKTTKINSMWTTGHLHRISNQQRTAHSSLWHSSHPFGLHWCIDRIEQHEYKMHTLGHPSIYCWKTSICCITIPFFLQIIPLFSLCKFLFVPTPQQPSLFWLIIPATKTGF